MPRARRLLIRVFEALKLNKECVSAFFGRNDGPQYLIFRDGEEHFKITITPIKGNDEYVPATKS